MEKNPNKLKICENCGEKYKKRPSEAYWQFEQRRFCGKRCAGKYLNPRIPNSEFKARYRKIKVGGGRVVLEHRWIMEQHLGRPLESWEQVHHINHNRLDNRVENLEVVSSEEHSKRHTFLPVSKECVICGALFIPHKTKRRRAQTCSSTCKSKLQRLRNEERRTNRA